AQEQQTATSEILRVISSSPSDVQPVFETILQRAVELCGARNGSLFRFDGELMHAAAHHNLPPDTLEILSKEFPAAPSPGTLSGLTILSRRVTAIEDVLIEANYKSIAAHAGGFRSLLGVPLLSDGNPIGAIVIVRGDPGPFSDKQISLLQTFADQAVIAIENVRLFTELQEKNQALTTAHAQVTEALEQQTATSDVLRVISSSPTDVQPVFDSIAASALRLCDARLCTVFRFDGKLIHLVALQQVSTEGSAAYRNAYPARPGRGGGTHRAILTRRIVHIPDIRDDPEYELQDLARANQFGCVLSVPMFRDGHPIGAITVGREAARPFSNAQIELLRTFADQAVIAIENVRLFNELQTSNRDLTTALDKQTATSDILRVISQSQTDVQPVFDAIVASAVRLLGGYAGTMTRVAGDQVALVAFTSTAAAGDTTLTETF